MRHAAWIRAGNDAKPMACVVWDQSDDGARIAAAHANKLPSEFTLVRDKLWSRLCRVVWRKGSLVGVQFIERTDEDTDTQAFAARRAPAPVPERPLPDIFAMIAATRYQPPIRAAKRDGTVVSRIAAGFLIALVAQAMLLYAARHESQQGVRWAANLCGDAGGLCQHPLIPFGASALMAVVYFAVKGMEL